MAGRPQVDLGVGQSVINAWAQGRAELLARQKQAEEQQQLAVQNEQVRIKQEEDKRQFDEQQKLRKQRLSDEKDRFNAEQSIRTAIQRLNEYKMKFDLAQDVEKGTPPPGATFLRQDTVESSPGVFDKYDVYNTPFGEISARTPDTVSAQKARALGIENDEDFKKVEKELRLKHALGLQEDEISGGRKFDYEVILQRMKNDAALELARRNNANDLEVARIRSSGSEGAGLNTLAQAYLQNPDLAYDLNVGTPKMRAEAIGQLANLGYDIKSNQQKIVNELAPTTLGYINDILDDKDFKYGFASVLKGIPGTSYFESAKKVESLKAALTVPEIKYIKGLGQMSDSDRQFITNIATKMDIGNPNIVEEVKKLKTIYEKAVATTTPNITKAAPKETPAQGAKTEATKSRLKFLGTEPAVK